MEKVYYFDNAATTFPKHENVYKAMDEANRDYAVNAGRGAYALARKASEVISENKTADHGIDGDRECSRGCIYSLCYACM